MCGDGPEPPPVPGGVLDEERHPERYRISELDAVQTYIAAIDFGPLRSKLCASPGQEGGLGWTRAKAAAVEDQYKNWLYLRRKYDGDKLPPSPDIDQFWHAHMLDTRAYHRDCARIFGTYHHHFPYFGARGSQDRAELMRAWERCLALYELEFGEPIYQVGDNG
ncbi:MAG: hypothetical protein WAW85_01240 [Gordonia sp. (in: high G+C Gram-positive bacteria)]|uniref:glycine-rich domain-containing protein n=1 Tax=Gordonia sp. (in: high G+C Gram-positive bacteria) TaxID=84139 RepID=UPI003BB56AB7